MGNVCVYQIKDSSSMSFVNFLPPWQTRIMKWMLWLKVRMWFNSTLLTFLSEKWQGQETGAPEGATQEWRQPWCTEAPCRRLPLGGEREGQRSAGVATDASAQRGGAGLCGGA